MSAIGEPTANAYMFVIDSNDKQYEKLLLADFEVELPLVPSRAVDLEETLGIQKKDSLTTTTSPSANTRSGSRPLTIRL